MKKIINFLQRVNLARIVLVFLAGAVLFVSTACTNPTNVARRVDSNYPDQPSARDNRLMSGGDTQRTRRDNPPSYRLDRNMERHMEESYTPTAPRKGMNEGLDVDIRQKDNYSAAQKRTEQLVDRAEKRLDKTSRVGDMERRASEEGIRRNYDSDRTAEKVSDSLEDMGRGARRGLENLKENVGSAIDDASGNVKDMTR
ncbi:DUF6658 family protein [Pannus brasiliensis CCIBt3594]|uniref:DUF6658 family protein n=1 Tax=Pannus brasiliensis CCIBt3594 TaxID=1427578 RepID=A0AAW9QS25_9CHRO